MTGRWLLTLSLSAVAMAAPPWEKSKTAGQDLYREHCAVCHDINKPASASKKLGPSLHHLFKNERLPLSRGKPNRPYVIVRIKFGGPLMPAFAKKMTDAQIETLVDYIATK